MDALQVFAGPAARRHLRERGLRAQDVRVVPAAAGGPKGIVLSALDRFVFGHWLAGSPHVVHLLGASIGAWRMACACLPDADAALAQLAEDYIGQTYEHAPGRPPTPEHVSERFGARLAERFGGREAAVLAHPTRRLHVFTSRGIGALAGAGRTRMTLGYLGAWAANAVARRAMGGFLERVLFSDPRDPLLVPVDDYPTRQVALTPANLAPAVLASCSIPFWLAPLPAIPGAPPGPYWDGGIVDYHLHLDYAALGGDGLVLYPHFQRRLIPGWLDKALPHRHRASRGLDNVVVLAPNPDWVATLPARKLPDRDDFRRHLDDDAARMREWRRSVAEGRRLADEFAQLVERPSIDAAPL